MLLSVFTQVWIRFVNLWLSLARFLDLHFKALLAMASIKL